MNFAKVSKPISKMLKKGEQIKSDGDHSIAFQGIKDAIKNALVLRTPDYSKPMHICSFASFHTFAAILLQKNEEGFKQQITFLSKSL